VNSLRRLPWLALLLITAALALVAAGCGGDDEEAAPPAETAPADTGAAPAEPAPAEEASRDGDLALSYGPLSEGDRLVVYMQLQVNPTNVGRRSADVGLYDGESLVARVERTITVFP